MLQSQRVEKILDKIDQLLWHLLEKYKLVFPKKFFTKGLESYEKKWGVKNNDQ